MALRHCLPGGALSCEVVQAAARLQKYSNARRLSEMSGCINKWLFTLVLNSARGRDTLLRAGVVCVPCMTDVRTASWSSLV